MQAHASAFENKRLGERMNSSFRSNTPEDVRPYVPKWGREQPPQKSGNYDIFSDEENPSYREMAQMFSPQQPPENVRAGGSNKLLLRFLGIVGVAATALALFVGYVVTQPQEGTLVAGRGSDSAGGVTKAIDAVQATFSAALPQPATRQPAPAPATPKESAAPESKAAEPANVTAPQPASDPAPIAVALPDAASSAAPEETPEPSQPVSAAPEAPAQVAALTSEPEPAPVKPVVPELSPGELATLMARGRRFIENGDFASARPVYRRAAEAGYAEAAVALGETYDPRVLAQKGAVGINPNVDEARRWYTKARDMGSLEAPTRLDRLR